MSLDEWWAVYCLRFGPACLDEAASEEEFNFIRTVQADLGVPFPGDVWDEFRKRRATPDWLWLPIQE